MRPIYNTIATANGGTSISQQRSAVDGGAAGGGRFGTKAGLATTEQSVFRGQTGNPPAPLKAVNTTNRFDGKTLKNRLGETEPKGAAVPEQENLNPMQRWKRAVEQHNARIGIENEAPRESVEEIPDRSVAGGGTTFAAARSRFSGGINDSSRPAKGSGSVAVREEVLPPRANVGQISAASQATEPNSIGGGKGEEMFRRRFQTLEGMDRKTAPVVATEAPRQLPLWKQQLQQQQEEKEMMATRSTLVPQTLPISLPNAQPDTVPIDHAADPSSSQSLPPPPPAPTMMKEKEDQVELNVVPAVVEHRDPSRTAASEEVTDNASVAESSTGAREKPLRRNQGEARERPARENHSKARRGRPPLPATVRERIAEHSFSSADEDDHYLPLVDSYNIPPARAHRGYHLPAVPRTPAQVAEIRAELKEARREHRTLLEKLATIEEERELIRSERAQLQAERAGLHRDRDELAAKVESLRSMLYKGHQDPCLMRCGYSTDALGYMRDDPRAFMMGITPPPKPKHFRRYRMSTGTKAVHQSLRDFKSRMGRWWRNLFLAPQEEDEWSEVEDSRDEDVTDEEQRTEPKTRRSRRQDRHQTTRNSNTSREPNRESRTRAAEKPKKTDKASKRGVTRSKAPKLDLDESIRIEKHLKRREDDATQKIAALESQLSSLVNRLQSMDAAEEQEASGVRRHDNRREQGPLVRRAGDALRAKAPSGISRPIAARRPTGAFVSERTRRTSDSDDLDDSENSGYESSVLYPDADL